ncbi:unnamed protein product [Pipistrellus nathusii]|uniref:Uncharacterized protein n=1 Tax=Pipistrellus nathusii TaxID=59473 RepID=A0ABP0AHP5_PIPNA
MPSKQLLSPQWFRPDPCPAPGLGPSLGGSPWLSKKRNQTINKNNSKATGRPSQKTRKENVRSFTSGTRGYFMPQLPSPSEEKDVLGHCRRQGLGKLGLLQQIFIGRLLYARHCGIPNYTSSLTVIKKEKHLKNMS